MATLIKTPADWIPIAMSCLALAIVLGHFAIYGIVHEADEGAAAHIFQLLIVGQLPIIGFFALKNLPRIPAGAVAVLAIQAVATLPAFAAVYFLT